MKSSFNDGWSVRPWAFIFAALGGSRPPATDVTLLHDAQFDLTRDPGKQPEHVNLRVETARPVTPV